ncbi:cation diffusion facilitator family transporter [Neisseria weaveri]|uniref:cation diffusion facilitator family transporter n=1 Tax=Neisseria weaveri TaxID=28091 RepID=UPI000D3160AF|nr:cation diffusion facilitator family transporter [Neisseria weaveri]
MPSNRHHAHHNNLRTLAVSFGLIGGFMLVEFIGGLWSNSLALLSDAGHMLSDAASLLLALLAVAWGRKNSTARHTFGFKRLEILAALFNGLTLLAIAAYICYEAVSRLMSPQSVASTEMLVIAAIGLGINLFVAWYMHRGGDIEHNLNMKAAYLHVLGDLLGSLAAITAALLIMAFGWLWADPLTSLIVAVLIVRGGWSTARQAWHILMEASPEIDLEAVLALLKSDHRVQSVHDVHLWSIASGIHALSCHLVVDGSLTVAEITDLQHVLEHKLHTLGIRHTSIQIESTAHGHDESILCRPQAENRHHHH